MMFHNDSEAMQKTSYFNLQFMHVRSLRMYIRSLIFISCNQVLLRCTVALDCVRQHFLSSLWKGNIVDAEPVRFKLKFLIFCLMYVQLLANVFDHS